MAIWTVWYWKCFLYLFLVMKYYSSIKQKLKAGQVNLLQSTAKGVFLWNMTDVHVRFAAVLRNSDKILIRLSDREREQWDIQWLCLHYKITMQKYKDFLVKTLQSQDNKLVYTRQLIKQNDKSSSWHISSYLGASNWIPWNKKEF